MQNKISVFIKKYFIRILLVILIAILGMFLRWHALNMIGPDMDEENYVSIAKEYSELLKKGNLNGIIEYKTNIEHPVFLKLSYGLGLLIAEKIGYNCEGCNQDLFVTRIVSTAFTVPHLVIISAISPAAGLLFAISSLQIKYSVETMFDGASSFFATLAFVLFIFRYKNKYFIYLSALIFGFAFASKYTSITTAITIFVMMVYYIAKKKMKAREMLFFILISVIVFFMLDPILWNNPIVVFKKSILYHASYMNGEHVKEVNLPFYMPILYFIQGKINEWNPGAFYINADLIIFVLGIIGLPFLYFRIKPIFIWYMINFVCLLIYPTKWPQYTLILIPAVTISGGIFIESLVKFLVLNKNDHVS